MPTLTPKNLQTYIRNLEDLHQTFTRLELTEAAASAVKCIDAAKRYLAFIKRNKLILRLGKITGLLKQHGFNRLTPIHPCIRKVSANRR